jgi:hypothetical protein
LHEQKTGINIFIDVKKLTLIGILSLTISAVYSQQDMLIFKKNNKTIDRYWKGMTFAFQLKNGQWQKGEITGIRNDSFFIRPMIVNYSFWGTDTLHYFIQGFSVSDIYALPKKGVLIDHKNGQYQISSSGGHVHWYWIKSGWIFRVGAIGYATLHITNGLIQNDFSFSESKEELGIAAGVFLFGVLLKQLYTPTLRVKGKYHMEYLNLSQ